MRKVADFQNNEISSILKLTLTGRHFQFIGKITIQFAKLLIEYISTQILNEFASSKRRSIKAFFAFLKLQYAI